MPKGEPSPLRYKDMSPRHAERARAADAAFARMPSSETIAHYDPLLIGEGGEHAVFVVAPNLSRERGVVVKVDRMTVINGVRTNLARGTTLDHLAADDRQAIKVRLASMRASLRRMRTYFGESMLHERPMLAKVPVTKELLDVLAMPREQRPLLPPGTHEVMALVIAQEKAPEAAVGPGSHGLRNHYLERRQIAPPVYEAYNRACIDQPETNACADVLPIVARETEAFELAKRDPALRAALQRFFHNAIRFTEETGDILDFIGADNVRCYKDGEGRWRVILLDARTSPAVFTKAQEALRALQQHHPITFGEQVALLNALNYVRYVNAAAGALSMVERLHIAQTPIARMSSTLLAQLQFVRGVGTPSPKNT